MKRAERVFDYARDRMSLGFEAFAAQHPDLVMLYTIALPKPGARVVATKEVDTGVSNASPATVKALRSEAFRTRLVRLHTKMETLTIGRDESQDVALSDDENVSSRHAELRSESDGLRLRDLGSKNGTTVNGVRIPPEGHLVVAGDLIGVGSTVLQVVSPTQLYEVLSTLLDPHIALPS